MIKSVNTGTASDKDVALYQSGYISLWKSDKAAANAYRNQVGQILATNKEYAKAHPMYAKAKGYDQKIATLQKIYNSMNIDETNKNNQTNQNGIRIIHDARSKDNIHNQIGPKQDSLNNKKESWLDYYDGE